MRINEFTKGNKVQEALATPAVSRHIVQIPRQ